MFEFAPYSPAAESAVREIWMQAFDTAADYWPVFTERIGPENVRTLKHGGTPIGLLGVYRMGQWFGGHAVPSGGFAAVAIAPEHRQRGAAKHMLTASLQELRAAKIPIASLYPTSQAVYRSIGFEQAGSRCFYELPVRSIGLRERGLAARRVPSDGSAGFDDVYRQFAQTQNGTVERTPGLWERLLVNPSGDPQYAYVVEEDGQPAGYVIYHLDGSGSDGQTRIAVRDWCALSGAAARRIWSLLADHGTMVESVCWFGAARDDMLAHVAECKPTKISLQRWMLRLLDVPAALAARGYPGANGELHLDVTDPLIAENTGPLVLTVRDGSATVEPGGRGDLKCDIRGLGPLYTGMFRPDTLARLGWITGTPAAIDTATTLFAGPEPWMPEYF